jgi:hypothetical protein
MITLTVRQVCRDYDSWRPDFDAGAPGRAADGCRWERVYRAVDDPDAVAVVMEWRSAEAAQGYLSALLGQEHPEHEAVQWPPTVAFGEPVDPG